MERLAEVDRSPPHHICLALGGSNMPNGIGTKARTRGFSPIESLEVRRLLTTFTVTSNGDLGIGTLRQAIILANAMPGADTIAFNITGTPTIHPLTALPAVTGPTTIDGTTQPGYAAAGHPIVFI